MMKEKKVLVSGCFDLLHSGHVAFFKEAASYGKLHVAVGADENLLLLKGKAPYFSQQERVYMVNSIKYVEHAFVASGSGMLDFEPDIERVKPDIFVVNSDGHTEDKKALCKKHNLEYVVLERIPEEGLPARSSSGSKKDLRFPFRVCIAGGWLDQPWVSSINPGAVTVAQIWPTIDFNDRSGMATSSRKIAIDIWGDRYPEGDPLINSRYLFGAENYPGVEYVSGSQDQLGLIMPGINRLNYNGEYWPQRIDSSVDKATCDWLSNVLHLVPLKPRPDGYDPIGIKDLRKDWISLLGDAGYLCYESIIKHDVIGLGRSMSLTLDMWRKILPNTVPDWVLDEAGPYRHHPGLITSGAGGGYLMIASEDKIEGALKIKIRY